jgi:hypothetical protein
MTSLGFLAAMFAPAADPPPLTDEQIARVRNLVKTHQDEQRTLKAALDALQKKLAECYSQYELDEKAAQALQGEVLEVQGKLLKSYHTMQTELRAIVGPERFKILSARIENALRNPPPPKK